MEQVERIRKEKERAWTDMEVSLAFQSVVYTPPSLHEDASAASSGSCPTETRAPSVQPYARVPTRCFRALFGAGCMLSNFLWVLFLFHELCRAQQKFLFVVCSLVGLTGA